jgi:tRNA(Arg) A34 adenosine deaminase TadA
MKKCALLLIFVIGTAFAGKKPDEFYMQRAINLAKRNPKAPFAALIVDNATGKVIAEGLNASTKNPTFHGEIAAINNCLRKHPKIDWSTVTLYTTAEPCPMCQSAIIWANISRVVFASSISYLVSQGWNQIKINAAEVNSTALFYHGTIAGGVLSEQANKLFEKKK